MRPTKYKKSLILLSAIFTTLISHAQDAAPAAAPAPVAPAPDYSMYLLVAVACVLLIAIVVLGQVLIRLTIYTYQNKSKIAKSVMLFLIMAGVGHSLMAQDATAAAAPAVAKVAESSSPLFSMNFLAALTVILTEVIVIFIMLIRIWALINTIYPKTEAKKGLGFELPKWFDNFNASVAVEHEKDIMLDHNYDGIRELDNQLPPWWKYGFLLTIVWAISYFSYYHIFEAAPLSAGEYENQMAEAKIAKDAYMKTMKNNVDETNVTFDKSYVADGAKIFADNCVACHGSKGEGGVGPNLTDDYWLHGGSIKDIFKTIKYGWPANGMKSWQTDFSAVQMAQVASYVKSIKGTNPENPKAPQGDKYEEGGAKADSTATASTAAKDSVSK